MTGYFGPMTFLEKKHWTLFILGHLINKVAVLLTFDKTFGPTTYCGII